MYCSFHKSNSHNTSECKALRRKSANRMNYNSREWNHNQRTYDRNVNNHPPRNQNQLQTQYRVAAKDKHDRSLRELDLKAGDKSR